MNRRINPVGCTVRAIQYLPTTKQPAGCTPCYIHQSKCRKRTLHNQRRVDGFSYVEVLIAMALIAVALVPAMDALHPGTTGAETHASATDLHYHLTGKLEDLLAEPFSALDDEAMSVGSPSVATQYSDDAGTVNRRLVFLSRYDADNLDGDADFFTGVDADLVWMRVEIAATSQAMEALTSRYE